MTLSARKKRGLVVLGILLAAFAIRLGGIDDRGYPFSFYDDETSNLKKAVQFYRPTGLNLNPEWFNKPAFGYYLNFGEFGFYYLYGRYVSGEFASSADFANAFFNDRGPFYLIARFFNCLSAVLTIWVLYALASRWFDRRVGILAALVLALLPGHVIWSQMVKHDILSALLATLSMAYLFRAADKDRVRDWLLAGFFAGLGAATKYTPFVMALPIFCLWAFGGPFGARTLRERFRGPVFGRFAGAGAALFGGFFVGSPYNLLDGTWLRENLGPQINFTQTLLFGAGDVDPANDSVWNQLVRLFNTLDDARCFGCHDLARWPRPRDLASITRRRR